MLHFARRSKIYYLAKRTTHHSSKNSCKNPECVTKLENSINRKMGLYLVFFAIGGAVEVYTFSKTNSVTNSTGLGWALLACVLV